MSGNCDARVRINRIVPGTPWSWTVSLKNTQWPDGVSLAATLAVRGVAIATLTTSNGGLSVGSAGTDGSRLLTVQASPAVTGLLSSGTVRFALFRVFGDGARRDVFAVTLPVRPEAVPT